MEWLTVEFYDEHNILLGIEKVDCFKIYADMKKFNVPHGTSKILVKIREGPSNSDEESSEEEEEEEGEEGLFYFSDEDEP